MQKICSQVMESDGHKNKHIDLIHYRMKMLYYTHIIYYFLSPQLYRPEWLSASSTICPLSNS